MTKSILLTHNDFDAAVCAVVALRTNTVQKVEYHDYKTIDKAVLKALEAGYDFIYLADISVEPDTAQKMNEAGNCRLFDHHKTAEEKLSTLNYPWITIDQTMCGAKVFAQYFNTEELKDVEKLLYHANDYDMWIHESPHSKRLNMLLWLYGIEKFVERFVKNPSVMLTEEENKMVDDYVEKRRAYVTKATDSMITVKDKQNRPVAIVFAEKYASDIGQNILYCYPDIEYVVIINMVEGTVSFRSRQVDVSELAKFFGGGGHKLSAGCEMRPIDILRTFVLAKVRV